MPYQTCGGARHTSLSDAEQKQLARAVRQDLIDLYHGRLTLNPMDTQALRLLLVAQRQGLNLTPLLEMRRDALAPGIMPGTVRICTAKHRNRKVRSNTGRAVPTGTAGMETSEQNLAFTLSEGAVLQQAISVSEPLVTEAAAKLKERVWLYRTSSPKAKDSVFCLTSGSVARSIQALINRHGLLGDDGLPLKLNLSRLRKSYFDRALRLADGDLAIIANLMGNTPQVAGSNYPSMNEHRKAEAAGFMNSDLTAMMRGNAPVRAGGLHITEIKLHTAARAMDREPQAPFTATAVAGCTDSLHGEYAPRDGHNHCDRYVMCLFCPNCAIAGTVVELWRLFSFQAFAREELAYLDSALGTQRTADAVLEDLRDRYRLAIAYIDDFTKRQFAISRIDQARAKTAAGLHPYWAHQLTVSRRARQQGLGATAGLAGAYRAEMGADRHGS